MPYLRNIDHLPVLLTRHLGKSTSEEHAAHLAATTELFRERCAAGERLVIIADMSLGVGMTSAQRKVHAAWVTETRDLRRQVLIDTVFVITSPVMRASIMAVVWFANEKEPGTVVESMDEAVSSALATLAKEGIEPPPGLVKEGAWAFV